MLIFFSIIIRVEMIIGIGCESATSFRGRSAKSDERRIPMQAQSIFSRLGKLENEMCVIDKKIDLVVKLLR